MRSAVSVLPRMEPTHRYGLWRAAAGAVRAASLFGFAQDHHLVLRKAAVEHMRKEKKATTPSGNHATGMIR